MYDGLLHDGGTELFASLQIKDMNPRVDSYTRTNAILQVDTGIEAAKLELQELEQAFLLLQNPMIWKCKYKAQSKIWKRREKVLKNYTYKLPK